MRMPSFSSVLIAPGEKEVKASDIASYLAYEVPMTVKIRT
jgi:hypothetical protein